jgi:hypothetical protein
LEGSYEGRPELIAAIRPLLEARNAVEQQVVTRPIHSIVRPIEALKSFSSKKLSACRRNSSAIIGGFVLIVETTVTRTPRL